MITKIGVYDVFVQSTRNLVAVACRCPLVNNDRHHWTEGRLSERLECG